MNRLGWVSLTLVILTMVVGGALNVSQMLKSGDRYVGHEVFDTETEYVSFKKALVEADATWDKESNKMWVLSSAPPIIVDFNVDVPQNKLFPYGEKENNRVVEFLLGLVIMLAMGMCATCLIIYAERKSK